MTEIVRPRSKAPIPRAVVIALAIFLGVGLYFRARPATGWWIDAPEEISGERTWATKEPPPGREIQSGGELHLPLVVDVDSFNPYTARPNADTRAVLSRIFPRLTQEEPDSYDGPPTFRPDIAESWQVATDGRSIRFLLRKCNWSDGRPMSSEDVRFSWEAATHSLVNWRNQSIVDGVEGVEIHDSRELTVRFASDSPYNLMDISDIQIIPKHVFEAVAFADWRTRGKWIDAAKVAGGPYRLKQYKPNELVTLTRNDEYWDRGKPHIDTIYFRLFEDSDQMFEALLAGEIDVIRKVPFEKSARVREDPRFSLFSFQSRSYGFIAWNHENALFKDPRVRRALTHAIPRENIVATEFGEDSKVAAPAVISCFWASHRGISPLPFDPERSKALLAEAGFRPGENGILERDGEPFRFELITNDSNQVRVGIGRDICKRLEEVGIAAELRPLPSPTLGERVVKTHEFDAALVGLNTPTKVDLYPSYHSSSIERGRNFMSFRDDETDRLLEQTRRIFEPTEAKALWDKIQLRLHELQPVTMIYEERGRAALHKRIQNVRVTYSSVYDNLPDWWLAD